jgi:hypothetical protein
MTSSNSTSKLEALTALKSRRMDGLRMLRFTREQADILRDPCSEIMLTGSNRGGKTLLSAARFAAIARDVPLMTMDGDLIDCRLPHQKDRALLMWVIGDYLKHIGQTIYRVLFRPGLFKMVLDEQTGWWRAWNPVMFPADRDIPRHKQMPAPPLIPGFSLEKDIDKNSDILDVAWYHANLNQFESVTLKNGTQILAYANSSEVKQGDPVDEIWIDEQLVFDEYYDEYVMRLLDNAGRLLWSTIPRDASAAYGQVEERAIMQEEEVSRGERKPEEITTRLHRVTLAKNPFISEEQKAMANERLSGDRAQLVRIQGMRSDRIIAVYGEFNPDFHCVKYHDDLMNDRVTKALEKNNWAPPANWTRELIIDPGTVKPAVLFGTVPPPDLWDHGEPYFIVYGEIYIRRLDAFGIAAKIAEMEIDPTFERMIIDNQMARQKPAGFSKTVGQQYADAFKTKQIQAVQTGYSFLPGDPDFQQRSTKVRTALRMRPCGRPQFRIITQRCPETVKQMLRNVRKTDKQGNPLEEPAEHQQDDLRVTVEYWLSRHPTWIEPPESIDRSKEPGLRAWEQWIKEQDERLGKSRTDGSIPIGIAG